ncbi:hypothetical protein [Aerosakkonema funiforme]|uniref:hypothetical protein n=1 Tax=Aerosakkonema funiforme TaxID=1246630 RepID=UPI0035BC69A6
MREQTRWDAIALSQIQGLGDNCMQPLNLNGGRTFIKNISYQYIVSSKAQISLQLIE